MHCGARLLGGLLLTAVAVISCAPVPADGNAADGGAAARPGPGNLDAAPAAAQETRGGGGSEPSPAPLPQKIAVSYSSVAATWLPVWLAHDQGLFAKNGLDVDVNYIGSGTTSLQSLIAGDLQFTLNSGAEPASAYLGGAPVRIVLAWSRVLSAWFITDPAITAPEQLRGKAIGITRFGGQPHIGARLALNKWGLDPTNDVQYLQLGGVPEILGGMQNGTVSGGALSPPTNVVAQRLGFRVLGDLSRMDIPYQASTMTSLQPYLDANPAVVRRMAHALLEGIKLSLDDEAVARAAVASYTRLDDAEMLDATMETYRGTTQRIPYPSLEGLQTILDELAEGDPRARTVQPQQIVDTTALDELQRDGFIKQLYGE
jgi:NitT/TauT family transport system substrate-binding protein